MVEELDSRDAPRVSVIIPAYRAAGFIGQAMESIQAQTLTAWEAIVINDGCPDTAALEAALGPFMGRITYLKQENGGPAAARNHGIRLARGELLGFLDADDYWDPRFLEEQVQFLDRNPTIDLISCDGVLFGEGPRAGRRFMELTEQSAEPSFLALISGKASVITSGTVVRKSRVDSVGGFDEALRLSEDFDLWIRLARSGATLALQDKVLLHRRFHEQNLTRDSIRMVGAEITVLEKVAALEDLDASERAAVNQSLRRLGADLALERGKEQFRQREFDRARCEIARANEVHQSAKLTFVLLGLRLAPNLLHRIDRLRLWLPRFVIGRGVD